MGKFKQGIFKAKFPNKYKGNANNIVYRSSYELKLYMHLDNHHSVEWWSSEELSIPYWSPLDNRKHRYFPDVILKKKHDPAIIMIEVKPATQVSMPKEKKTKKGNHAVSYIREMKEWGKNQAKWEAARNFCDKKGWQFIVMTEKELGIKRNNK